GRQRDRRARVVGRGQLDAGRRFPDDVVGLAIDQAGNARPVAAVVNDRIAGLQGTIRGDGDGVDRAFGKYVGAAVEGVPAAGDLSEALLRVTTRRGQRDGGAVHGVVVRRRQLDLVRVGRILDDVIDVAARQAADVGAAAVVVNHFVAGVESRVET